MNKKIAVLFVLLSVTADSLNNRAIPEFFMSDNGHTQFFLVPKLNFPFTN
jgi:hypothetical protein